MKVGDHAYGGIIAYINNEHGFVVSNEDIGQSSWGCYGYMGATGITRGSGLYNTIAIMQNCIDDDSAAKLCVNYSGGGYTDWVLPSLFEFRSFYNLHWSGLCNFTTGNTIDDIEGRYYTSTEVGPNFGGIYESYQFAFSKSINYTPDIIKENYYWLTYGGVDKGYVYNVRAIRYF